MGGPPHSDKLTSGVPAAPVATAPSTAHSSATVAKLGVNAADSLPPVPKPIPSREIPSGLAPQLGQTPAPTAPPAFTPASLIPPTAPPRTQVGRKEGVVRPVVTAQPGTGNRLKADSFAGSCGLLEEDVRYLAAEGVIPSAILTNIKNTKLDRFRLFESTLAEIPMLLVRLADEEGGVEGVADLLTEAEALGLRVLHWRGDECLTIPSWNQLVGARGPPTLSLDELAGHLEVSDERTLEN